MILHVLIAMIAGWIQRHQQQVIAYLQEENRTFHRIPTKQKRRSTGPGAKKSVDPQRPEKKWVPDGASGHELSRPKRVSWLPAYGMMWATSIPVSCGGVKMHVFMDDLVVTP
jgi:hypothetical protein